MNLSGISLRLSVTDACQLQCRYCRPTKDTRSAIELPAADVKSPDVIAVARELSRWGNQAAAWPKYLRHRRPRHVQAIPSRHAGRLLKTIVYCGLIGMLPLISGCAHVQALCTNPWAERVITYTPGLTWTLLKWTVGCGLLAIPFSWIVFLGLRKIGGFRWNWKHAKYFRVLVCVLVVLVTVSSAALVGLSEGIYRGLRKVVNSPEFKEELRPVGGSGADIVGAIYIVVARTPVEELIAALKEEQERLTSGDKPADGDDSSPVEDDTAAGEALHAEEKKGPAMLALENRIKADLDTFRKGEWEVNVAELKKKARETNDRVFDVVLPGIKDSIREEFPSLKNGRDAKVLDWFIDTFGEMLITKLVEDELKRAKLKDPIVMIWYGLESAAKESGDPETISYDTLSGYLPSRVIYASVVYPTKLAIRSNQTGVILIWFLIIILFVIFFQVAELSRVRNLHGRSWDWIKARTWHTDPAPRGSIITPELEKPRKQSESPLEEDPERSENE